MDEEAYRIEAQVEASLWWFRIRRRLLAGFIKSLSPPIPPQARILDAGCGTGTNLEVTYTGSRRVVGIDRSRLPLRLNREKNRKGPPLFVADVLSLPFAKDSFDLVVALDLLEHLDDDEAGAVELARTSRPGGIVIIFVPALNSLWGIQDEIGHHKRRYRKHELQDVLEGAGLEILRSTYFNSLLLPPIFAVRMALRLHRPSWLETENQVGGRLSNALFEKIFGAEAKILRHFDLPLGVSLACIARKKGKI